MDYRIRKHLPHDRPDWVDERQTLFVTLCHKRRGLTISMRPLLGLPWRRQRITCGSAVNGPRYCCWPCPTICMRWSGYREAMPSPRSSATLSVRSRIGIRRNGRPVVLNTACVAKLSIWRSARTFCKIRYAHIWSLVPRIGPTPSPGSDDTFFCR
jgi:hypothetical protein